MYVPSALQPIPDSLQQQATTWPPYAEFDMAFGVLIQPSPTVTTQPIKSKWGNFPAKTNANASDALSPCFRQVDK